MNATQPSVSSNNYVILSQSWWTKDLRFAQSRAKGSPASCQSSSWASKPFYEPHPALEILLITIAVSLTNEELSTK
jgi:hypothetical protein